MGLLIIKSMKTAHLFQSNRLHLFILPHELFFFKKNNRIRLISVFLLQKKTQHIILCITIRDLKGVKKNPYR